MTDYPNAERFRFIRLRCPLCGHTSPLCDQTGDVRRDLLRQWWEKHKQSVHPYPAPKFEVATPTEVEAARRLSGGAA